MKSVRQAKCFFLRLKISAVTGTTIAQQAVATSTTKKVASPLNKMPR